MLKIRKFVQGQDEKRWIDVWNKVCTEFEELRALTVDDVIRFESSPSFDINGLFLAEFNAQPVGLVYAQVDRFREERKGFIQSVKVVPEHRGKGIGRKLVERAIESFRKRGMERVEAVASKKEAIKLFEGMGFKQVRVYSLMKRALESLPQNIGENQEVVLRKLHRRDKADIELLTFLENDTFSEHYNFRPASVEEVEHMLYENPSFREQEWLFVDLGNEPVGYVGTGIDSKYNQERNTRAGWIMDIGVLKAHRRRGVGIRLMIEGMKLLKAKGMNEVMLGVDDQNPTKAIKLYEKLGFQAARKDIAYLKTISKNA